MRLLAILALAFALFAPATAGAGAQQNPAVCVNLAHRLVHYDNMKMRAAKLGNAQWVARFDAHIDKLEDDHARLCPDSAKANKTAQQLRDLLVMAGKSALTFFTMGLY